MEMPLGTTVNMTGPHGFFVLDAVHAGDVVFAATGTGIAAVMPMLGELGQQVLQNDRALEARHVTLLHRVEHLAHAAHGQALLNFVFVEDELAHASRNYGAHSVKKNRTTVIARVTAKNPHATLVAVA